MKRTTKLFLFISGIVIVGIIHLSYFSFYDKQLQQLQDHSIVNSESIKTSNKFFEEFKYVKPNFTVNVLFYAPVAGFMGAHILVSEFSNLVFNLRLRDHLLIALW